MLSNINTPVVPLKDITKLMVLKRISFGIRNFDRFRIRILHYSI